MTNLETSFLELLTREAVRFCSRAVRLFPAPLAQTVRPSYGTFVNVFAKKALAGPYGSYDNVNYLQRRKIICHWILYGIAKRAASLAQKRWVEP